MKATKAQLFSAAQRGAIVLALGLAAACSSSSDSAANGDTVSLGAVVQDLNSDRNGFTVVMNVPTYAASVTTGSIEASGGQVAQTVSAIGDEVSVTFSQRVTPNHQVRVVGISGISNEWRSVTTSDPRAPQMDVLSATQDVSDSNLGGDQLSVFFVAGPRVLESDVENADNWTLRVEGVELDLTGSTIIHDVTNQVATFTLGSLANLHSSFTIAGNLRTVADTQLSTAAIVGAATGDAVAPTLDGGSPVAQDITVTTGDELGQVVVVDFSEPISPVFGATSSNFSILDHGDAQGTTVISRVAVDTTDNSRVRLSFTRPVVPGFDQLVIGNVLDAHGNPFASQTSAIAAGSTVVNGFTSVNFETIEGAGNDRIVAVLDQAIDPDTAEDPTRWSLDVDSAPVNLANQVIEYDLATRTMTFNLDFDAANGITADLASNGVVDIDGETFTQAAPQVLAAGDSTAPAVVATIQNRTADGSGQIVDVEFSEELDVATATNASNYTFNPSITVQSATLLSGSTVRLTLQSPAIPGDHTLTVLQAVSDPAGNDLGGNVGPTALTSTDSVAPTIVSSSAVSIEGAENDVLVAFFSDTLVAADAEDVLRWTLESPTGTPLDLTGSTINFDSSNNLATLILGASGAPSFIVGDDFTLGITSVRDIGGNASAALESVGVAAGETRRPALSGVFVGASANEINFRFDEPMGGLDDLYDAANNVLGARYEVIDPTTMQTWLPSSAVVFDRGLGVVVTYPAAIDPAATVNVIGLRDLAGNTLFPIVGEAISALSTAAPAITGTTPTVSAVQGVDNDEIVVVFDSAIGPWNATNAENYAVQDLDTGTPVDLTDAVIGFDGDRTVTITLGEASDANAVASHTYDVSVEVAASDPIRSVQGVALPSQALANGVTVSGDTVSGPTQGGTVAFLDPEDPNALFVVFDETVDETSAETAAAYDYNTGTVATAAVVQDGRVVRLTFPSAVALGGTLDITAVAAVDTAGNAALGTISLAVTQDSSAPFIDSSSSTIKEGVGGDIIGVTFNEAIESTNGIDITDFAVTVGGEEQRIGAVFWNPQTFEARILVEDMSEGATAQVTVTGVTDFAGNAPAAPLTTDVVINGDVTVPSVDVAYVNGAEGLAGQTLDVLFSEDVVTSFVTSAANWSTSDNESFLNIEMLDSQAVRITFTGQLDVGATVTLAAGLTDFAGNEETSPIVITPVR